MLKTSRVEMKTCEHCVSAFEIANFNSMLEIFLHIPGILYIIRHNIYRATHSASIICSSLSSTGNGSQYGTDSAPH
jgi:hypothetical protein